MLIRILLDTEIPNRPLLKAGEVVSVEADLANRLVGLGHAEAETIGYETQDLSPRKRKK